MTQEEKAKAYDEAIKRGLDYIRYTPATEIVTRQDIFEAIFPELAESEDEKIRKVEPLSILDYMPYLRPMSSMTDEEKEELAQFHIWNDGEEIFPDCNCRLNDIIGAIDWLNEHHFDYRGLIEKNLAIEVTEENNPYKE